MYEIPSAIPASRPIPSENRYAADRSGRPLTADDRYPGTADSVADPRVPALLLEMRFNAPLVLQFEQAECPVRPIVARLLKWLALSDGRPVALDKVCQHLWRRPTAPSYSTFHVTIFKANSALKKAECPLRLKSRLNHLVMVIE